MKQLYDRLGVWCYYVIWPLLCIYQPLTHRTRVVVRCGSDILLLRGWLSNGLWQLPGGGVHFGERAADGAVRELHEETGIAVSAPYMQQIAQGRLTAWPSYAYTLFVVDLPGKPEIRMQRGEVIDSVWMPLEQAAADPSVDDSNRRLLLLLLQ